MNKKLHFLLFCLLIIVIFCSCKDKLLETLGNLEPFGNQIVIHPDTAELNPRETTFSILTYDTDLGSGVTQAGICRDDSSWTSGDKTCIDYSLSGSNCEDIGSDGRLAFDACKVSCDNCNTYTEVKRRLPSPVEEVDEPSYAQFEGSISDGSTGSDIGGPDYREIISRLDDMKDGMGTMRNDVVASSDLVSLSLDNMSEELRGSLSGVDSDGDGALTSEEFIQFYAERGALGSRAATANLAKGRILIQGKNTIERLLEVISLFKRNSEYTGDKVPDLPVNTTINVADYDALEGDVQGLKTHIEPLNSNTAPREIIRNIYKIIVYFARLRLPDNGIPTGDSDTYKSKLGVLDEKKNNLLQKLVNNPRANPNIVSDLEVNINAEIGNANNIFNPPGPPPPPPPPLPPEDTFINPDNQVTAQYMSNVLTALDEFRKILVDFQGLLQADVDGASGVILPNTPSTNNPPPTTPQLTDARQKRIEEAAVAEYKEKLEAEEGANETKNLEIGAAVGVAAAIGIAAYLATQ